MQSLTPEFLQAAGSIGTAFAAVAAVATFWFAVRKSKADIRRTYSAAVRRNITDFEFQLKIWQDNFRDSQYLIVATAALGDALQREGVPSPATQAFDEYIERHGGSLCLDVWSTAIQSTDTDRYQRSFVRAASNLEELLSIVGSASQLFHTLTRELQSPKFLQDLVEQLAVPERRLLLEEERRGTDRMVSRREEVRQFVDHARAGLAMQQERCMTTIESVNRFFRGFIREIRSLSDKELYRLSHVPVSVRIKVAESDKPTREMAILLKGIKKTVTIDEADELVGAIADIERETKFLAAPDGAE